MTPPPEISVIIAVRDGARYLGPSLQTVLDQRGPAFEVVVVDDGSTDRTLAILNEVAETDSRLIVVPSTAQGFTASLGVAVASASGAYLARHDLDDLSLPGRFESQWRFLESHPEVAAVGSAAVVIDAHDAVVGPFPTAHGVAAVRQGLLTLRATPVHGSMMIRRAALEAVGGYRRAFRVAQDYDLWLRLSERFGVDVLNEVLYRWRLSPTGAYGTRRAEQLQFAGIARTFATERARFGQDSYDRLTRCDGDLSGFVEGYRLAGPLHALWGELLYRGLNDPAIARRHLGRAILSGVTQPRTVILWLWASLGLGWPGGRPMAAAQEARS